MRRKTTPLFSLLFSLICLFLTHSETAFAQFEEPEIREVRNSERQEFQNLFGNIAGTRQGLFNATTIDRLSTVEVRARLHAVFGDPTQNISDLIKESFRPGKAVPFEYWFVIAGE